MEMEIIKDQWAEYVSLHSPLTKQDARILHDFLHDVNIEPTEIIVDLACKGFSVTEIMGKLLGYYYHEWRGLNKNEWNDRRTLYLPQMDMSSLW